MIFVAAVVVIVEVIVGFGRRFGVFIQTLSIFLVYVLTLAWVSRRLWWWRRWRCLCRVLLEILIVISSFAAISMLFMVGHGLTDSIGVVKPTLERKRRIDCITCCCCCCTASIVVVVICCIRFFGQFLFAPCPVVAVWCGRRLGVEVGQVVDALAYIVELF